jgi:hypothetical protein
MTLSGGTGLPCLTDQQSDSVEKTPMYRSPWELAAYVRHRNAYLAHERLVCSQIDRAGARPANLVTQIRHRLGIGLIRVGHALAGNDTVRGLPKAHVRPATWSPGS